MPLFKLQVQDDDKDPGIWHDVKTPDGRVLTFTDREAARATLERMFPVLVKMEQYKADLKRTRVIAILDDKADDEWRGNPEK